MLSQSEIDALLGALESRGDAQPGRPAPDARPSRQARTYDFRRPDKFSKDQLRTLQAVHENFARLTAGRLQARLRMPVSMQLADAEQMIFDEHVGAMPLPTQLAVLLSDALGGPFLLNVDLGLAFALIDRLLGGPGRLPASRREPTAIESELIARVVDELRAPLDEAWAHLGHLQTRVSELALGPALLRVAAPSAVVAVLTFEVRFAGQAAPVSICYPHSTLEPLLPKLSATAWYAQPVRGSASGFHRETIEASLQDVAIPIEALLGTVELPVEDLASLQPGDVIRVDERMDRPVPLLVGGGVRAWGVPGRVGDRMALRIVTPLQARED